MCRKNPFFYLKLIFLVSWVISLNPGLNDHLKENCKIFRSRSLHFVNLNTNSLLPKMNELRKKRIEKKYQTQRLLGLQKQN